MAQLKDSLITGDLRVTGTIYGDGKGITDLNVDHISTGTLLVARGGTSRNSLTTNAIIAGNGTSAVNMIGTASGALFATSTNGAARFGTLPIAQGGTGATTAAAAKSNIGLGNVVNINQSKAIKSITRSGTTFTATALDGTTTTFTQQDNNTTYSAATSSSAGLMSASDKAKLDGIASGANKYTHPGYTAHSSGLYKVTVDSTGHVSSVASVSKSDITALGIPGQDTNTTYSDATTSAHGLMSAEDKVSLDKLKTHTHGLKDNSLANLTRSIPDQSDDKTWSTSIGENPIEGGYIVKAIRCQSHTPDWLLGGYTSGIAFGGEDTRGVISIDYNSGSKKVRVAGAARNSVSWYADLLHSKNYTEYVKSTTKSFTLSASSWSSGSYTISDSLITASSNQEVLPATTITAAQYNALSKAQIIDGGQAAGSLTLKALGTVPTIDIPIRIIFRGTI